MAEQGDTPGGRRGYAGTWPPRATAQAGGYVPAGFNLWPSFVTTLRDWARARAAAVKPYATKPANGTTPKRSEPAKPGSKKS